MTAKTNPEIGAAPAEPFEHSARRDLRDAIAGGRVTEIEIIGDAARLAALDLAVLHD